MDLLANIPCEVVRTGPADDWNPTGPVVYAGRYADCVDYIGNLFIPRNYDLRDSNGLWLSYVIR